jgi:hypothetical protein
MKALHQKLLKELTETCQTQDESKHPHIAAMIKGLRFVLEQIQVCIFIHTFSFVLALGSCIALLSQLCRNLFLVISDNEKCLIFASIYIIFHIFWEKTARNFSDLACIFVDQICCNVHITEYEHLSTANLCIICDIFLFLFAAFYLCWRHYIFLLNLIRF